MMRMTVRYMAQVRHAAGVAVEEVTTGEACSVRQLVRLVADRNGETLRQILLDQNEQPQPTILLFVNDRHVAAGDDLPLCDGDTITLLSPISGG